MRLIILIVTLTPILAPLPPSYVDVLSQTIAFRGGAHLDDLGSPAALAIEQQLKKVMGSDPTLDLNVSQVRSMSDNEILRILTLAMLGNFTSKASFSWQRECSVEVDPRTGSIYIEDASEANGVALRVLLVGLCAAHLKRWLETPSEKAQKDK